MLFNRRVGVWYFERDISLIDVSHIERLFLSFLFLFCPSFFRLSPFFLVLVQVHK